MPASPRRWVQLAGAAAVLGFLTLVARFWDPVFGLTAFIQLDHSYDANKIAEFREQPVFVYPQPGPYDGVAYSQIAYHPLLGSTELRDAVDNLSYRARRILPSALAWLLAAGDPALIVQAYCALNILAWLALAAFLWRLIPVRDGRTWLAWAGVLFSAGALYSVRFALPDLIAALLVAAAVAAAERGRRAPGLGLLAAAALTRETALLAWPSFAKRPWMSRRNLAGLALAALPLLAWLAYIRLRVGPLSAGVRNLGWPLAGYALKWRQTAGAVRDGRYPLLAWADLLSLAGLTVQAAFLVGRRAPRDLWWRTGAAYAALMLVLGAPVWEGFNTAAQRVLLPMTIAFNLLAGRRNASTAWLVAGNLGILAGLIPLSRPPLDDRELLGVRRHGRACVVEAGSGWFGCERERRHIWAWSGGDARLDFQAWPLAPQTVSIRFRLRSLSPRTVAIREDGRPLWRGEVGRSPVAAEVPVRIDDGGARLDFSTDAPPVLESGRPDARRLSFALMDPALGGL